MNREERERFEEFSKQGPRELAGMLIDAEKAISKRRAECVKLRAELETTKTQRNALAAALVEAVGKDGLRDVLVRVGLSPKDAGL